MAAAMCAPGDFSFVGDENSKVMLKDMYDAVTVSENWANLKGFVPSDGGFMFSAKPEWFSLIDKAVNYGGHSGASYGWTMRCIDYIAKHGWENFMLKMSKPDGETQKRLRKMELPYSIQEAKNELEAWKMRIKENPSTDAATIERGRLRIQEATLKVADLESELYVLSM
jgi:hypothetical protein